MKKKVQELKKLEDRLNGLKLSLKIKEMDLKTLEASLKVGEKLSCKKGRSK